MISVLALPRIAGKTLKDTETSLVGLHGHLLVVHAHAIQQGMPRKLRFSTGKRICSQRSEARAHT